MNTNYAIERIYSNHPAIDGWYLYTDGTDFPDKATLTWSNFGNGPEVQHDWVEGPYSTEQAAETAARTYFAAVAPGRCASGRPGGHLLKGNK